MDQSTRCQQSRGGRLLGALLLLCTVGLLLAGPALAVTAQTSELPFDGMGERAVNSARNVWIPAIVTLGIIALAVAFIVGFQRLAGYSVRTAIALGLLSVAATGAGLAGLFPGLITTVILP
jgi:hypothetical protein